jgi:NAD-dependent deacetylase sirtuin 1
MFFLRKQSIPLSILVPDFRSRNGIYARLREEFPELPNPQSMFDIEYFTQDPRPFFRFAKEIWPGQYQPSLSHYFIAELERRNKLLRNYTQNIDSLEHLCPITRLIQCHGSFSTATCRNCLTRFNSDDIKKEILQQIIPYCTKCSKSIHRAILKPDIVFFGEPLPEDFHKTITIDRDKCDLLIVMGSSLKVKPVSLVSELIPAHIPQILINRERLQHKSFDIELLGNCDVIINELCRRLAQVEPSFGQMKRLNTKSMKEIHYEHLRASIQKHKRKKHRNSSYTTTASIPLPKERLSSLRPRLFKPTPTISSSSSIPSTTTSRKRPYSALKSSSLFNPHLSYISYPPRRYLFTGAEVYFSSSDDDDASDDDLPRKHTE